MKKGIAVVLVAVVLLSGWIAVWVFLTGGVPEAGDDPARKGGTSRHVASPS